MHKVKFVYFDIGGVLILDFTGTDEWLEMKKDLGAHGEVSEKLDVFRDNHEKKFCMGLDADEILSTISAETGVAFRDGYSMTADFVNRFNLNRSIWPLVERVEASYKVGLLTNMYPRMLKLIQARELIPNIKWDSIVDSSAIGIAKPDAGIYEVAEAQAKVKPEEILFIDNAPANVEAAAKRGWQVFLYDNLNPTKASKELEKFLDEIESTH